MATKYLYIDSASSILKSIRPDLYTYEFTLDSDEFKIDSSRKLVTIGDKKRILDLPPTMKYYINNSNSDIEFSELLETPCKLKFRDRIKINGVNYYIKDTCKYKDKFMYSCFITDKVGRFEYHEESIGSYCIIPADAKFDDYVAYINNNSPDIYIEYTNDVFDMQKRTLCNITGIDLLNTKLEHIIHNTRVYSDETKFYLDEVGQTAQLIRDIKHLFPEVQLYTDANNRSNYNNVEEFLYYKSQIFDDESPFSSIVHKDHMYKRVLRQAITVTFKYETYNINQYLNRRNEYLNGEFIQKINYIYPNIKRGVPIRIGINWLRDLRELDPEKVQDESDRYVYAFTTRCIIHGLLLESYDNPATIDRVIANIYPAPRSELASSYDNLEYTITGEEYIKGGV